VSPAAPYRHFRDRDELLIDVARRGFDRFAVTLESAWDGGRPDAFTAFDRVGKAYLRFARSEPAYYSAMFEAGIPPEASPELQEAGQRAFAVCSTLRSSSRAESQARRSGQCGPHGSGGAPSRRSRGHRWWLIGLFPVVGDIITTALSLFIVHEAYQLGAPGHVIARMSAT
jgi:AcrR family transcriptional regulator